MMICCQGPTEFHEGVEEFFLSIVCATKCLDYHFVRLGLPAWTASAPTMLCPRSFPCNTTTSHTEWLGWADGRRLSSTQREGQTSFGNPTRLAGSGGSLWGKEFYEEAHRYQCRWPSGNSRKLRCLCSTRGTTGQALSR